MTTPEINEWPGLPDDFEPGVPGTVEGGPRSADFNQMRDAIAYLFGGPRLTLVRNTSWDVETQQDTAITWTSALVDEGGWWDSDSPEVAVVPETRMYLASLRLLWPGSGAGTYRRWRLLRDDEGVGGNRQAAAPFHEHGESFPITLTAGQSLAVDLRHDAGSTLTIDPATPSSNGAWRSPILQLVPLLTPGSD